MLCKTQSYSSFNLDIDQGRWSDGSFASDGQSGTFVSGQFTWIHFQIGSHRFPDFLLGIEDGVRTSDEAFNFDTIAWDGISRSQQNLNL